MKKCSFFINELQCSSLCKGCLPENHYIHKAKLLVGNEGLGKSCSYDLSLLNKLPIPSLNTSKQLQL